MSVQEVLERKGKRRLLALDGGGIRGMISLEILRGIEAVFRAERNDDDLVLADVFDYVAGTSTGAIIAACISRGMSISELTEFYRSSGKDMFEPASVLKRLSYKYESEPLARKLKEVLGSTTTVGDPDLRTLLMAVLRNATTDSPWPVSSNPNAKYNDRKTRRNDCNLDIPLWQVVRASTAAPSYFPAEAVTLGEQTFVFVDGGVTMYNNPAFQLFLMATLAPYRLEWKTGTDQMLLVSVGTGSAPKVTDKSAGQMWLPDHLGATSALMYAAAREQDLLCRTFGNCRYGPQIDSEVGDLIGVAAPGGAKLFSYLRYDANLSQTGLEELGLANLNSANVQRMDGVNYIDDLTAVGAAFAKARITRKHFEGFLQ